MKFWIQVFNISYYARLEVFSLSSLDAFSDWRFTTTMWIPPMASQEKRSSKINLSSITWLERIWCQGYLQITQGLNGQQLKHWGVSRNLSLMTNKRTTRRSQSWYSWGARAATKGLETAARGRQPLISVQSNWENALVALDFSPSNFRLRLVLGHHHWLGLQISPPLSSCSKFQSSTVQSQ